MARFLLINNTTADLPLRDSRRIPAQKTLAVEQITFEIRRLERAGRITIKDQTTIATATGADLTPLFVDVLPLPSTLATTVTAVKPNTPAAGASTYVHTQSAAEAVWEITHNLGKFPSVVVFDSSEDEVEGKIKHITENELLIIFSAAFTGRAILN